MITACPICTSIQAQTVFESSRAPLTVAVTSDHSPADDDYAPLGIVLCGNCGHMYNAAFDPDVSEKMYSDTFLTNMPVHVTMVDSLRSIVQWIGAETFSGKRVVEVGAGSGHVSRVIAEQADAVTIFEPCLGLKPEMVPEDNIHVINAMFSAESLDTAVDLVVCRQVIEHVADPGALISDIAQVLKPGGHAYLEVPSAEFIFEQLAICDLHMAHVQYFSKTNFLTLAARADLTPLRSQDIKDGHDFGILFEKTSAATSEPPPPIQNADAFRRAVDNAIGIAARRFTALSGGVGIYGATWHSQSCVSLLPESPPVTIAFDDNPQLHGATLHGGGYPIPICAPTPEAIAGLDTIIIGAYLHDRVISEKLRSMGFEGEILSVARACPPDNAAAMTSLFQEGAS